MPILPFLFVGQTSRFSALPTFAQMLMCPAADTAGKECRGRTGLSSAQWLGNQERRSAVGSGISVFRIEQS